ncbi:helix-turn-helix domain-containing protein [Actinoplanes sp. NPDC051346]|uniref:helix-turn-helix domain-containing protein n=1 Tax=Actinoplanes sp. NPDC051346 TaxID=3155048 RepID=UPI0034146D6A
MELGNSLATLRRIRGWTQEELAERCGLSVRTIRNVELGRVGSPRRSSVYLLLRALDLNGTERRFDSPAEPRRWRGLPPPQHSVVGLSTELEDLARTLLTSRITTFFGPGGVGKTRVALGVAAEVGASFRDGVAVVELGGLPAESSGSAASIAAVVDQVWPMFDAGVDAALPRMDRHALLILDNAEHLPAATAAAAKELVSRYPSLHILITSRRPLAGRLGMSREIRPLAVDALDGDDPARGPAVELLLRCASAHPVAAANVAGELPAVIELCRRAAGLPRVIEFCAERLRTIPIRSLLAAGPTLGMLRTSDHSLLPHQRSLAASIRWSIALLTDQNRGLLRRLADLPPTRFGIDDVLAAGDTPAGEDPASTMCLFSDLVDSGLLTAFTDRLHEYRLLPYVREVLRADSTPQPELSR